MSANGPLAPYRLSARADDGGVTPIEVRVFAPETMRDGACYGSRLTCASLGFHERPIYGATPGQAFALSLWLVEDQLTCRRWTLIDGEGSLIEPPIDRTAGVPKKNLA